jgi:uncharacterized protein YdeI (YjbR/CyaY-like superfamily)
MLDLASAAEWAAWLELHHASSDGVTLRLSKAGAKKRLDYAEALELALCWGWIDGHKRGLDELSWLQRFTPRRKASLWSKINCAKAEALIASGAMQPPGLAEVERARADGRWARAYDGGRTSVAPADLLAALEKKRGALAFFEQLDGANRYAILFAVQTAKKPETRAARIARFVELCAKKETLHPPRARRKKA